MSHAPTQLGGGANLPFPPTITEDQQAYVSTAMIGMQQNPMLIPTLENPALSGNNSRGVEAAWDAQADAKPNGGSDEDVNETDPKKKRLARKAELARASRKRKKSLRATA